MSLDLPTRLDLYALGRDYILGANEKISSSTIDTDGSNANIVVGSTSVMAKTIVDQLAYEVSQMFLDTVEAERLDRWALDRYQAVRKGASSAVGTVRFYRAAYTAGAGSIPIGTKVRSLTGVDFVTTSVAVFGSTSVESSCFVRAVQAGKSSQVSAQLIRTIPGASALFDPTIQVTNDVDTAGGENAEDDDTFKERLRSFWRTARRGVLAALEYGAKTVPGVVSAQAIELMSPTTLAVAGISESWKLPARLVQLHIADSSGVASEALAQLVRVALEDYRACGIGVLVRTSIPVLVPITLALTFKTNVDTVSLSDAIVAAIVEYVNSLPVNGTLYRSALFSVLQRYTDVGLLVNSTTITAPTGDIVPSTGSTLRTTRSNITIGVV